MAMILNGTNSAEIVYPALVSGVQDYTFFCLVETSTPPNDTGGDQTLVGMHDSSVSTRMAALRLGDADKKFYARQRLRLESWVVTDPTVAVSASVYRVAMRWDQSEGILTINVDDNAKVILDQINNPTLDDALRFCIGNAFGSGAVQNAFFKGKVQYATQWIGTALSDVELADIMNGTTRPKDSATTPDYSYPLISDGSSDIGGTALTLVNSPTFDGVDLWGGAAPSDNIDTDNEVDQFQRTVALNHSLASPLTSVLINNVEHIDLIQNSDAELKYIKRCYSEIGSDVTSVILKNGVDADVTIPSVTVNTTHPYPVPNEAVDSNSMFSGVTVSGSNASFRITSQPTKGTLDLSDPAKYLHDVDASKGGVYTPNPGATGTDSFTFEVHDPDESVALNRTQSGTVTINIAELGPDTTKPVITLIGDAVVYVGQNDTYTDAGANVTDNVDADSTLVAQGSVDTATLGTYTLTYNYTDAAGNAADTVTRTVHVIDAKPVITLNGSSTAFVDLNATYTDAGATWNDAKDGTGSVTAVGVVDTATVGTYTLTYDHTDTDTNAADTKYRSVVVRDPDEVTANKSILKSIWTPII